MVLPLEPLAQLGEEPDLARDQLVELVALDAPEVAVEDPALPAEAAGALERPVPLDSNALGHRFVDMRAQLRLVRLEQFGRVGANAHAPDPTRGKTPLSGEADKLRGSPNRAHEGRAKA